MAKGRVEIVVTGLVQGVFYRATTQRKAAGLGLTGWVRNNRDGSVQIVAEGEEKNLRELVGWCRKGPPGARVIDVRADWREYSGRFEGFSIKY